MEDRPGSTLAGGLCVLHHFCQGMANQKHEREWQHRSKGIKKEESLCTCCWPGGLFCLTRAE